MQGVVTVAAVAGAASVGVASASLALMGLGVPFLLGALLAAVCAAGLVYAAARRLLRVPPPAPVQPDPVDLERIKLIESLSSALRHDLRGVLSPALMVSDRLVSSEDPKIRRAGEVVVKSIERATVLLAENKLAEVAGPPAGG